MTNDTIYIKHDGSWVDITSFRIKTYFEDNGVKALDKLDVDLDRSILDEDYKPEFEKEVRLEIDGELVFGGTVQKPTKKVDMYSFVAYSYGQEFMDVYVNEVYDSGEALEAIVQDLVEKYTDLTWTAPTATGISIDEEIVFKDMRLHEVLDLIVVQILDYVFVTTPEKNSTIMRKGSESSGVTFTVGENIVVPPEWNEEPNSIVRKVIVEGGVTTFETTDTFSPNGVLTEFSMNKTPVGNVRVEIDGTKQEPKVEGATTAGAYTLRTERKKIVFDTAPSGTTGTIKYEYAVPIRVEAQTGSGKPERKVKNKSIKSFGEARRFAQKYLDNHKEGQLNGTLLADKFYTDAKSGMTAYVSDSYGNVERNIVIKSVIYEMPDGLTSYEVGTAIETHFDWQKEVVERLRGLEQTDSSSDLLQLYDLVQENIQITLTENTVAFTQAVHDTKYWGDGTNYGDAGAYWGDYREGDSFDTYDVASPLYTFAEVWSVTGSSVIIDGSLYLDGGSS